MSSISRYLLVAAGAAVLAFAGCEWLFGVDDTPPSCSIASPFDSTIVSGEVLLQAVASDSFGVAFVEFYVDGALLAVDSEPSYAATWDTQGLENGSWHSIHCIAYDPSDNAGHSDTVNVEVREGGQEEVFHGVVTLASGHYRGVDFEADSGDVVAGDARVVAGGPLSRFIILDEDNYSEYRNGGGYTALYEVQNASSVSVRETVAVAAEYYLVFENAGPDSLSCWVRFALE